MQAHIYVTLGSTPGACLQSRQVDPNTRVETSKEIANSSNDWGGRLSGFVVLCGSLVSAHNKPYEVLQVSYYTFPTPPSTHSFMSPCFEDSVFRSILKNIDSVMPPQDAVRDTIRSSFRHGGRSYSLRHCPRDKMGCAYHKRSTRWAAAAIP